MFFEDSDSLVAAIEEDINRIIYQIAEQIYDIVVENIWLVVYDPFENMVSMYERQGMNGGFVGSWVYTSPAYNSKGNLFSAIFSYDSGKNEDYAIGAFGNQEMVYDPDRYIHSSGQRDLSESQDVFLDIMNNASPEDRRPIMDRAIAEGTDYDFTGNEQGEGWWTKPRDYWNPSLLEILRREIIDNVATIYFKNNGINFIRG